MFNRNKPRLYIAYYTRGRVNATDVPFHTALLLAPKNPSSAAPDTVRYHVVNPIEGGKEVWKYEDRDTIFRTEKLVAVLLLGKVGNKKDLDDLLEAIPLVQDDPQWRCRHWVWAAIDSMAAQGILAGLPGDGEFVWRTGLQFARQHQRHDGPNLEVSLPMCDTSGLSIDD
ncbi:hypothetical protein B0H12DRAFT_468095 [Mycena haematopus]|nr:hypothetical protein B0H12DRAFT_468095 [Mycena haematopus]